MAKDYMSNLHQGGTFYSLFFGARVVAYTTVYCVLKSVTFEYSNVEY